MGDGKLGGSGDCENKLKVLWTKIDELPVERTKEVTPHPNPPNPIEGSFRYSLSDWLKGDWTYLHKIAKTVDSFPVDCFGL